MAVSVQFLATADNRRDIPSAMVGNHVFRRETALQVLVAAPLVVFGLDGTV